MKDLEEKEHVILSYVNSTIAQNIPTMKSQRMNSVKHLEETEKIQRLDRMLGQDWDNSPSESGGIGQRKRCSICVAIIIMHERKKILEKK